MTHYVVIFQGITRLERWERAEEYGLYPPREVKSIILQHPNDTTFTEWYVAEYYSFCVLYCFLTEKRSLIAVTVSLN